MNRLKSATNLQVTGRRSTGVRTSGGALVVGQLSGFKDGRLIAPMVRPDGVENAHPAVGERAQGHSVTFAFRPLASIIEQGPAFSQGRLPGKLMQDMAQRF